MRRNYKHNFNCNFCKSKHSESILNLGILPISNNFIEKKKLSKNYPLHLAKCASCGLYQTKYKIDSKVIFNKKYPYYSSVSQSWLQHCKKYTKDIIKKLNLNKKSFVIEIASNDGYLLQYFKKKKIPCLGVEPTKSTANISRKKGIETLNRFFSSKESKRIINKYKKADLIILKNVLAHVPDIADFVKGLSKLLNEKGIITLEFPSLINLISKSQFDTIYHEHYSYLNLLVVNKILKKFNLNIFDAETLSTHGGSYRVYISHKNNILNKITPRYSKLLNFERKYFKDSKKNNNDFRNKILSIKLSLRQFLEKNKKKKIVAYGAAAKGNTMINFALTENHKKIITHLFDANKKKQGLYFPGTNLMVENPLKIKNIKPDFIIILPWNIKEEVKKKLFYVRKWGCKFLTLVPKLHID